VGRVAVPGLGACGAAEVHAAWPRMGPPRAAQVGTAGPPLDSRHITAWSSHRASETLLIGMRHGRAHGSAVSPRIAITSLAFATLLSHVTTSITLAIPPSVVVLCPYINHRSHQDLDAYPPPLSSPRGQGVFLCVVEARTHSVTAPRAPQLLERTPCATTLRQVEGSSKPGLPDMPAPRPGPGSCPCGSLPEALGFIRFG
jgi:hypothetical protein